MARKISDYHLKKREETQKKFIDLLAQNNYIHISGDMVNSKTKVKVRCPHNHTWQVNYEHFKKGTRCPECRIIEGSLKKRLNLSTVKSRYALKGYEILSTYKNCHSKLKAKCPEGHIWEHLPSNFFKGEECFQCKGAKKYTVECAQAAFSDRGFIPLFDTYHHNKENLPFLCKEHIDLGVQYAPLHNMVRGLANCRKCYLLLFTGENSSRWKGGISPLNKTLREAVYEVWTKPSLEKYSFKCAITNSTKDLHVHHYKKNFSEIVKEALSNLSFEPQSKIGDFTVNELEQIKNECVRLHLNYGLGIPLTKKIHNLFHEIYGTSNNNEIQFNEFRNRYENGEFEALF
ncbi:hypothetical protein [Bacillus phage BUCT082]|nr:hypothetical protein [Bacillus phage BUCT082]CAF1785027.1 hypothetical protein NRS6108_04130 [Bacillus subtilis]